MPPTKKSRTEPRDRVVVGIFSAMIGVVLACVVVLWQLGRLDNRPAWWRSLDENPRNTEQAGIELENRITSALTRMRAHGEEDWTAAIDQDQLNSWLTHRLRETVRSLSSDPSIEQIGETRVAIDHQGITIGARFTHAHGSTVVWSVVDLGTDADGRFVIHTRRVYVGGTRVPAGLASRYLTSENLGNASIDLGDGRVVRIRGIRPGDHRLEFALRTEFAEQ